MRNFCYPKSEIKINLNFYKPSFVSQAEGLFGLAERTAAVESAIFLASQLKMLTSGGENISRDGERPLPKLDEFLPEERKEVVKEYDEKVGN